MTITTISEVKFAADLTSEYDDVDILNEIDLVESDLYDRYYLPKRSQITLSSDYNDYYFSKEKAHEIIRLQVAVDVSVDISGWLIVEEASDTWSFLNPNNFLTFDDAFLSTYDGQSIRIQYIPSNLHHIAKYQAALNLIDTVTIVDGEEQIPPLVTRIRARLQRYKDLIKPRFLIKSNISVEYDRYEYVSITQSNYR